MTDLAALAALLEEHTPQADVSYGEPYLNGCGCGADIRYETWPAHVARVLVDAGYRARAAA